MQSLQRKALCKLTRAWKILSWLMAMQAWVQIRLISPIFFIFTIQKKTIRRQKGKMTGKMTAHKHMDFPEEMFAKLNKEAQALGLPTSVFIRRKLENPPVPEEILLLRKLEKIFFERFKEVLKNAK